MRYIFAFLIFCSLIVLAYAQGFEGTLPDGNTPIFNANKNIIDGGARGSSLTTNLGSPVNITVAGTYVDGPSVAQGSTGTWFASGTVVVATGAAANIVTCRLSDGTNTISSGTVQTGGNLAFSMHLSGIRTSPSGNLRISCTNQSAGTGSINTSNGVDGNASTISAIRIR